MIEGMIGGAMMLASFVSGYFFHRRQAVQAVPKEYIQQEIQMTPELEQQLENITNAWK